jgi:hypothetical protein
MARPSVQAVVSLAVVPVDGAVVPLPAVDAEALEALVLVLARASVAARRPWQRRALVHVLRAVLACNSTTGM